MTLKSARSAATLVAGALTASAIGLAAASGAAGAPGAATAVAPAPAATTVQPFSVTSFDGTTITGNVFVNQRTTTGHRAPTVLFGPGWGGEALSDPATPTSTSNGTVGVAPLLDAGYNVVSWNPRGFRTSTGLAQADSSRFEGRDVSAILTWVAAQKWAQLDRSGDPRTGMVGGSYGGEVQFAAAATDRRIDAIVPDIAWNSLVTSLAPNRTNRTGWSTLLNGGSQLAGQRNDPRIDASFQAATTSLRPTQEAVQFLGRRDRVDLAARVHAPTLIIQGTVDTLFPLDEAARNYRLIARNHVPVKMIWFCGGHGACLTNPGDTSVIERDTLSWLARYVQKQRVSTGPGFQWVDQKGVWHQAPVYRSDRAGWKGLQGTGSGTLDLVTTGGSGPGPSQLGPYATVVATKAANAVNVPLAVDRAATLLGAPQVSIRYSGQAPDPDARVLAQIVDDSTGLVLGSQITPIPVKLDGRHHRVSLPLEYVAATATPGSSFTLQLTAQSSQINTYPTGGSVTFDRIQVSLPTRSH